MGEELKQIVDAAIEMRQLQRKYFRTRDKDILIKSKAAEDKLDRLLEGYTNPKLF